MDIQANTPPGQCVGCPDENNTNGRFVVTWWERDRYVSAVVCSVHVYETE